MGAALTFSAVVQPHLELRHWPLIPLAAGLAVAQGLRAVGVEPALKWPNDVLLGGNKVAGILVERVGDPACAVVGIGINVDLQPEELPVPTATSLAIAGARTSRAEVFGAVLAALDHHMTTLQHSPETTLAHYRTACDTLGREVEAHLPGEIRERGQAVGIDESGRLQIAVGDRTLAVAAGDVIHLRPA